MQLIKLSFSLLIATLLGSNSVKAQLFIQNADFMIQAGAVVTVQGDVESNVDILTDGAKTGLLLLKGSSLQNVDMKGFIIPNLEVDNATNANLTGNAKISETLRFTTGKIVANDFNLRIDHDAIMSNYDANKFVVTNGLGELQKEVLAADLASYEMPVGQGTSYNPLLLTTAGPYQPNAVIGVRDTLNKHPHLFPQATDFLLNYWPITQSGITTLNAKGNYIDPNQVNGTDLKFAGFYWKKVPQQWGLEGTNVDPATNFTGNTLVGNGDLYAMNAFGLVRAKVLLQGAYDANVHLMRDDLRKGGNNVNLIPSSDPYRVAPYNTAFIHVNNPVAEQADATLFADQGLVDNNIVDWVYLELRKNNDPHTVVATRSALVQRDGDVIDIDGSSAIYFKDIPEGNDYTLSVRHRNHLGMSTDPANFPVTVNLAAPQLVDFTTLTDAQIFGPAAAYKIAADGKNNLWGGNGNMNPLVSYNGAANDKNFLLINTLNNNANLVITNTYNAADYNMNRIVSYNGASNDKNFLLINVLNNIDLAVKVQSLP